MKPEALAIDLETKGNEAHKYESEVVGLAISCNEEATYFSVQDDNDTYKVILDTLMETQVPLIAHNMAFDAAYLTRDYMAANNIIATHYQDFVFHNWHVCTYAAQKILASEGWNGQKAGLKACQVNLLGWEESNEVELDEWLFNNGYANSRHNVHKEEMWRAPYTILGKYCAMDAASTWLLWDKVQRPVTEKFTVSGMMLHTYWVDEIKHLIVSQLLGVRIDGDKLRGYQVELAGRKEAARRACIASVRQYIDLYNNQVVKAMEKAMPVQFKNQKALKAEPAKYKKDGTVTEKWCKWEQDKIFLVAFEPEETVHYKKWKAKLDTVKLLATNYEKLSEDEIGKYGLFNLNSTLQKQWLFYDQLKFEVKVWTKNEDNPQPATGGDALLGFGETGVLFQTYSDLTKELGYVDKAISLLIGHEWEDGEFLHFQFKAPGTITGRLSGTGGINVQQVPKTRGYLECYRPRDGYIWIDWDVAALEPTLLTETSRDKSLLKLYGPNAKQNDIYIFNGSAIPGIREEFIAEGYDPDNPTKEAISACKKKHKTLRGICKTLTLGASYGAGPGKIRESLALSGVHKSLAEVKSIHEAYWKLYAGTKEYNKFLERVWERTGGYILNGIGRPMPVDSSRLKDLVNSCMAEGTLILTRFDGPVPIESLTPEQQVWDGTDWVSFDYVSCNGKKLTIDLNGVNMTKDHDVLINDEWVEAKDVRMETIKQEYPRVGWGEVWGLCNSIRKALEKKWKVLCRGSLSSRRG